MRIWKWHSINLLPLVSITRISSNEKPYKILYSLFELILFGYVIHFNLPIKRLHFFPKIIGPLWSRKNHKWYWLNK